MNVAADVRAACKSPVRMLFSSNCGASDRLLPRWIFLRLLGIVYFSAFYSLIFQIKGLIGPGGILPAKTYLQAVAENFGAARFWYTPSLFWLNSSNAMLMTLCWLGLIASVLLIVNLWPRGLLVICFLCFISFVAAAGDFSGYQSDGMLLEAGFISLFFAAPGFRPGLGHAHPPSRASLFLLQWEWFRIYFESGIVKLASGDPQWHNFTAMDEYYQNGPLPTWIGWYLQHLPHGFHAFTVGATLVMELGLIWLILFPRRFRIVLFFIVTVWEIGVISSANYAFLNYLVLFLGILLVDDRFVLRWTPQALKTRFSTERIATNEKAREVRHWFEPLKLAIATVLLVWVFYATSAQLIWMLVPRLPLPRTPIGVLEPFRIANRYGLFAVMTRGRYEIEFQGSNDGVHWTPYPYRYKPQALNERPRIYAPYQPRFDWNLWFASLGTWRDNVIVPNTEVRLLANDRDVLSLFAGNPFAAGAPRQVRAVLWQYWFTSMAEKRATGNWWRRELLGTYAPTLELQPDGKIAMIAEPTVETPHE
ncbi:MAG TPA: lipase maturation factor family protein [Terriglobales bacterium]